MVELTSSIRLRRRDGNTILRRCLFGPRFESLVHFVEATLRVCIHTAGEKGHQKSAKLLALGEAHPVLIPRLQRKAVFAIEYLRKQQAAQPPHFLIGADFEQHRAKRHRAFAGRSQSHFETRTFFDGAADAPDERVPLRILLEVRQHLPDALWRSLNFY